MYSKAVPAGAAFSVYNRKGKYMFFRKKIFKSAEQKEAEALPRTKKVQYCAEDINDITERLNSSLDAILRLEPVNYYASKDTFLQCTFFYDEGYNTVYLVMEYFAGDRAVSSTPFYKADYELMKKALRYFGQQI